MAKYTEETADNSVQVQETIWLDSWIQVTPVAPSVRNSDAQKNPQIKQSGLNIHRPTS